MRKKNFEAPIAEIIYLSSADIITTSTESFDGEWVPIGGNSNDGEE